ncbi:MarR family transcriptional regulator [Micromonospora sp. WMMD1082]|uniref:MarR family winged helix-turn-helix transcriptional regulator n=1 Tax=Micromonospora sp. WMMD1082 TaxID=3016104 RepID=UPI00241690DD|nr:MarR family transcriptional regulator [Micromonospora sp. WMMD1082]MDG4794999.1 MarR family transcriptional regulator [Micromonospora sp. WMMD1082]
MSATVRRPAGIYRPPVGGHRARRVEPDLLACLCRSANVVRAYLERTVLRETGLTWTSYDVLELVCAGEVAEPADIARQAGVARATLTSALAQLSDRGLVRRELHEHDLRRVVIRPTQQGSSLAGMLRRQVAVRQAQLLRDAAMPPPDVVAVLRALADQFRAGAGPADTEPAR